MFTAWEIFCIVVLLFVVIGIITSIIDVCDQWDKKCQKKTQEYQNKINAIKNSIDESKRNFESILSSFFSYTSDSYQDGYDYYESIYSSLSKIINDMKNSNNQLIKTSQNDDRSSLIEKYIELTSDLRIFATKLKRFPYTKMIDESSYGKINKAYWNTVRSMSKQTVDSIIHDYAQRLAARDYAKVFAIDIDVVLKSIWFYATEKPYSAEALKRAVFVFKSVYKGPCVDVIIAELYSIKQVGGEEILRDKIQNLLKAQLSSEELTLIASALMWMNAYQTENVILQHMLSTGMQMTEKTQERLHSLINGGGKASNGFNVSSDESSIYFDVSALGWTDDEYIGLFENLAFQEKILSYSLAVRDEDKELFVTQGIKVPTLSMILTKMNEVFYKEYGSDAKASMKKCIALSGSGEETIIGILAISEKCKQMGLLLHVAYIGKKLNIKFYTLFMPNSNNLMEQKQQALSLYKKLSPSVAMWESSLKDTILFAIQQLLNSTAKYSNGNTSLSDKGPVF